MVQGGWFEFLRYIAVIRRHTRLWKCGHTTATTTVYTGFVPTLRQNLEGVGFVITDLRGHRPTLLLAAFNEKVACRRLL